MKNLFSSLPQAFDTEHVKELLRHDHVRIERIVSRGHTSPAEGWHDQQENEWVLLLQGSGTLLFQNGDERQLHTGDYVNIPAHTKHKVTHTDPNQPTIWLAIFYL